MWKLCPTMWFSNRARAFHWKTFFLPPITICCHCCTCVSRTTLWKDAHLARHTSFSLVICHFALWICLLFQALQSDYFKKKPYPCSNKLLPVPKPDELVTMAKRDPKRKRNDDAGLFICTVVWFLSYHNRFWFYSSGPAMRKKLQFENFAWSACIVTIPCTTWWFVINEFDNYNKIVFYYGAFDS